MYGNRLLTGSIKYFNLFLSQKIYFLARISRKYIYFYDNTSLGMKCLQQLSQV
jgi:hypothetical protein